MGITCEDITFLIMDASDWISIIGIVVNGVLAIWIVNTIQNRLNNKRVLKDHFKDEVKEVKSEYKDYLNNLYSGRVTPKNVLAWFKLMNIKVNDLMAHLKEIYKVDDKLLDPYQNELRELVTESDDFIEQFKKSKLELTPSSKNSLVKFQKENNKLFTTLIISINHR